MDLHHGMPVQENQFKGYRKEIKLYDLMVTDCCNKPYYFQGKISTINGWE